MKEQFRWPRTWCWQGRRAARASATGRHFGKPIDFASERFRHCSIRGKASGNENMFWFIKKKLYLNWPAADVSWLSTKSSPSRLSVFDADVISWLNCCSLPHSSATYCKSLGYSASNACLMCDDSSKWITSLTLYIVETVEGNSTGGSSVKFLSQQFCDLSPEAVSQIGITVGI